ncbi:MAG: hypothetical protein LBL09_01665 [Oscillospiraceae bacterium]|nr:hypothetical protein [Oscillospiraceae bacterium]
MKLFRGKTAQSATTSTSRGLPREVEVVADHGAWGSDTSGGARVCTTRQLLTHFRSCRKRRIFI